MSESTSKNLKIEEKHSELRSFWTLVHMLLSDTLKLSFGSKKEIKNSILRIVSLLVAFAALTAMGYLLYKLAILFGIFSLLSFVPQAVPSMVASVILIVSFFNDIVGLVKTLYFSEDNKLMITYPCRGSTVFIARLFVFYIKEYVRSLVVMVPVYLSYLIISHFPWYTFVWMFVALALVTAALVLVAALFSVPGYYIRLFLKRNSLVALTVDVALFAAAIWLVTWVMALIPNKIDIFSNFGPYFNQIQRGLQGYRDYCWFLFALTKMQIGSFDGFSVNIFTLSNFYVLLVIMGIILVFLVLSLTLVNKLYIHLASGSFEFDSVPSPFSKRAKARPFFFSQFSKEFILLEKNPELLTSLFGTFVILPIVMTLLNKIFGAMDTNYRGNMMISAVNLLLILLIALNSNETIAHSYSDEGKAFFLNKVYPQNSIKIMISKLIIPLTLGIISLVITSIFYGSVNASKLTKDGQSWINSAMIVYFSIGLCSFYAGHMLFAASCDFCNIKSTFSAQTSETSSQRNVAITAFILSLVMALLFYLFMDQDLNSAYLKIMIVGLVYLLLNIVLFVRKTKYIYGEGE